MATDGEWGRGSDCKEMGVGQSWPASTPPQSYLYITVSCLLIAHANLHPLLSPPHPPPHTHTHIPPHWQLTQHTTGLGLSGKLAAIVFVSKIFLFSYPATQSPAAFPHHHLTPRWVLSGTLERKAGWAPMKLSGRTRQIQAMASLAVKRCGGTAVR